MINESLYDEEFLIKSLKIVLDPQNIKRVKYHNSIFKVSNLIDRIYDYDTSQEVMYLIKNIYAMSGNKKQKGVFEIEMKSGSIFYINVSKDTLIVGKSIRMKNIVKFLIDIAVLMALNYICNI